jgi:hypothetical protein
LGGARDENARNRDAEAGDREGRGGEERDRPSGGRLAVRAWVAKGVTL